jgi:hypothetical protein
MARAATWQMAHGSEAYGSEAADGEWRRTASGGGRRTADGEWRRMADGGVRMAAVAVTGPGLRWSPSI